MTNSFSPVFDPDGKYLYFLSDRDFNEVIGNVDFEFSNPKTTRIYLVTLRADEPSPFQPQSDETQIKKEENKDELLTTPGKEPTGQQSRGKGKKKAEEPKDAKESGQGEGAKTIGPRLIKTRKMKKKSPRNSGLTSMVSRAA